MGEWIMGTITGDSLGTTIGSIPLFPTKYQGVELGLRAESFAAHDARNAGTATCQGPYGYSYKQTSYGIRIRHLDES